MGLLKDWADRWLHHRTTETGTLPVSADNENQRMSAVATDEGVLLFSDSVKGMKARSTYLQHLADGFFNFSKKVETLKLYEIEIPMRQMVKLADNCIDKLSKADLRRDDIQLRKSVCSFTPEKMSGKEMLVGAVCTGKYDLRPDFNNFDRLTKDFGLGISPRNYDVAALLYISENGYAGLMDADHFHPFSCQYEFKELAEKLGDSMKARREAPLSAHDFGYAALQMEAKTMARDILQSEFHITGGEFRLGGKANRTSQRAKTPEKCLSQQSKEPEPEKPGHQAAKHVSSIVPQKKEKKTTDYIICLWKRE
ncbi:DUF6047 family protein [Bacteroides cellulosilyticus]|jgi:hypothetical protein|uniref:Uncharacterized protein n=1 Tax=Bacteroides cellulosilyticus TaxID=246787 RepID=A0A6L3K6H9_9BACE|nr:DUF6047 family protein [Bacteroides cellulosilyticus]KAA5421678.1 hypothetical protein F2Y87_04020 [Bacteroides cellulosilyticus]